MEEKQFARGSRLSMLTRTAALLASVLAVSAQAQSGSAQDEASKPADPKAAEAKTTATATLDGVVVTGERLNRSLVDTTSSVSVTTDKQLREYDDEDVNDVLSRTGNAVPAQNGTFSLRGVSNLGAEGFTNGQSAQPVISTYLDGVSVDTTGASGNLLDTYDVEQIEIFRGSQSTNQGRNALGGAVIINTREPTDYWDLSAKVRAVQLGDREFAAAGGGPLGAGFAFRVVGNYEVDDGFIINPTLEDGNWNQRRDSLWRGKLAWKPTWLPDLSILLTSGRTKRNGGGNELNEEFDAEGDTFHRQATNNVETDIRTTAVPSSVRLKYRIAPKLEFTAITGYIVSHQELLQDYDRSEADNGTQSIDQRNHNFSQELRFNINKWHGLTGVFGFYGGRFEQSNRTFLSNLPLTVGDVLPLPGVGDNLVVRLDIDGSIESESRNYAAFTEFDYAVTSKLTVTAGLRYDYEKNTTFASSGLTRADLFLNPALPPIDVRPILAPIIGVENPGQTARQDFNALLPKIVVRYALTPETNVFAGYTEAYRAGGADVIINTGAINPFRPEFTRTYEVGARTALFGKFWRARANLYRTDWRDQQIQVRSEDGNSFFTQNAAKSRLYGAELENAFTLTRRWSAYATLGYSQTRFLDYVTANGDFSGNQFTYSPNFSGSIGTSYRSPIGLFASANLNHVNRYFLMASNEARGTSDSYELLDARIGYEYGSLSIALFARNLLDQDYATYRFSLAGGIGQQPGRLVGYGAPRVFGVQLDVRL